MNNTTIEFVGYLAGSITAVSLMPQVIKSWQTKSTEDISISWTSIYAISLILWIIYGIGIGSFPVMITVSIECLLAVSLLILKIKHG